MSSIHHNTRESEELRETPNTRSKQSNSHETHDAHASHTTDNTEHKQVHNKCLNPKETNHLTEEKSENLIVPENDNLIWEKPVLNATRQLPKNPKIE